MDDKEVLETKVYDDESEEIYRKFRFRINRIIDMLAPLMPWNIAADIYYAWQDKRRMTVAIDLGQEEAYRKRNEKIVK